MVSWTQALGIVNIGFVSSALSQGANAFVYRKLSSYFYGEGIGAAHSAGIIKRIMPEFKGSTYFDSYWQSKQEGDQAAYLGTLSGSDIIDSANMIERPLSQPRKYRYIGDFAYRDDMTGQITHEYKSYYSDEQLSISESNELLYDSFDKEKYPEWRSLEYVKFVNVEHNESWSY